jgi:hypothetical protein
MFLNGLAGGALARGDLNLARDLSPVSLATVVYVPVVVGVFCVFCVFCVANLVGVHVRAGQG